MTDLNKERELEDHIEVFKKEAMELWFVPNLADTYKNKDLFSYSIMDGEVFFMREQARQLWSFWNKAKAQAVPAGYTLINNESLLFHAQSIRMFNDGDWENHYEEIEEHVCSIEGMVKASESGAEG